jgi:hypothetical protein
MSEIDIIFGRMDRWRHLPTYQLERRADLFFALYIPEVLEDKLGFAIRSELIPEFPARIGTNFGGISNRSNNIDYLALSEDKKKAVFVELKTDDSSRNAKQDRYYATSREAGLKRLLEGILDIFRTQERQKYRSKYFCLIEQLASLEQYQIPDELRIIMKRANHTGYRNASRDIEVTSEVSECIVIYIQPNVQPNEEPEFDVITFEDFGRTILKNGDALSARFAKSLSEWAEVDPGTCD